MKTGIRFLIIDKYYKNKVARYDSYVLKRMCEEQWRFLLRKGWRFGYAPPYATSNLDDWISTSVEY